MGRGYHERLDQTARVEDSTTKKVLVGSFILLKLLQAFSCFYRV